MQRFYEKTAKITGPCPKSTNGRHRFVGYRLHSCRYCGKEKP